MNRRTKEEEDSGSDWDSMSEIGPPPSLKQGTQANGPPPQSLPALQPREKATPYVDSQVDNMPARENPPYNFRAEVKSPLHASVPLPKPGKQKKGKMYDPQSAPQKHVTFLGDQAAEHGKKLSGEAPDSDSEDPLYSIVKPKQRSKDNSQHQIPAEVEKHEVVGKPKKVARNNPKLSQKPLQGVDNHGYIEDQILPTSTMNLSGDASRDMHISDSPASAPQATHETPLPRFSESYFDHIKTSKSNDPHRVIHNNIATAKECSLPLIMTSGEALLESVGRRSVEAANRTLGEVFALITLPFTCFTLFLHHLLRFLLQGVLRPLLVDSVRLTIEYFIQPFVTWVMKPLWATIHVAVVNVSETLLVCVRPLTVILESIRLVEVHNTSRYSVEEI